MKDFLGLWAIQLFFQLSDEGWFRRVTRLAYFLLKNQGRRVKMNKAFSTRGKSLARLIKGMNTCRPQN